MEIIRITLNQLKEAVVNTLRLLFESHDIHLPIDVQFLSRNELKPMANDIWLMLNRSYEKLGGLKTYRDYNDFLSKLRYAKIATFNGRLIACAIYRKMDSSYKMVAIGSDGSIDGKEGVKKIIRHDIDNFQLHYWVEASGAIEYYFKQFNGYPIPNALANNVLNDDTYIPSNRDEVHYSRLIPKINGSRFEKMMFGFKDDKIYNQVIEYVDDYASFMKKVNKINESLRDGYYSFEDARLIIDSTMTANCDDGFYELSPRWRKCLEDATSSMRLYLESHGGDAEELLEDGHYLLKTMPMLTLNQLQLSDDDSVEAAMSSMIS